MATLRRVVLMQDKRGIQIVMVWPYTIIKKYNSQKTPTTLSGDVEKSSQGENIKLRSNKARFSICKVRSGCSRRSDRTPLNFFLRIHIPTAFGSRTRVSWYDLSCPCMEKKFNTIQNIRKSHFLLAPRTRQERKNGQFAGRRWRPTLSTYKGPTSILFNSLPGPLLIQQINGLKSLKRKDNSTIRLCKGDFRKPSVPIC